MNWEKLKETCPEAVQAFRDWARTKSTLCGWHVDMKAAPSPETAFALLIGPLMLFFREQDIVFSLSVTKHGRVMVTTKRPDRKGHYVCVAHTIARVDPAICFAYAFARGFEYLQDRINGHDRIPEHTEEILVEEPHQ